MAYNGPKITPGLSAQVLTNIPQKWNAEWFRQFCLNYLQYADVRNATSGTGISISGGINTPAATVAVSGAFQKLFNEPYLLAVAPSDTTLTDYRIITPESGVLTVTDGGALGDLTVGVATNGIGDTRFRQSVGLSVVGNATGITANVADIVSANEYDVLQNTGSGLAFGPLALAALPAIGSNTVLGNISVGSAAPAALTSAELATLVGYAGANPSATIGLAAVNGSATTFMRSDGAPALGVTISPTWTGNHTFSPSAGVGVAINAVNNSYGLTVVGGATSGESFGLFIEAGSTSADAALRVANYGASTNLLELYGDGGLVLGAPTGGDKGLGTLNATGLYVNGTSVAAPTGANPSATIGLSVVDGSAATFMRSDGAPALGVAISPTWTGNHTHTPGSGVGVTVNAFASSYGMAIAAGTSAGTSFGLIIEAGTNSADTALRITNAAVNANYFEVNGDGSGFAGLSSSSGIQWSSAGVVTVQQLAVTTDVVFYGTTPKGQRASTSIQRTSNLSSVTGTMSVSTAAFNQLYKSLGEVMNTLAAYGLWSIS